MREFKEWFHDEIFRMAVHGVCPVEEIIEGVEEGLEMIRAWQAEQAAAEAAQCDDTECDCLDDEEFEHWCAEQRLKNVLPADAPNPYFAPEVLEFLKRERVAAEVTTSNS